MGRFPTFEVGDADGRAGNPRVLKPAPTSGAYGFFLLFAFLPSGIAFGMLALGRESAAPPMSCLFGILCHATLDGFHSVANIENRRSASSAPQLGHGGDFSAEAETSSSNSSLHAVQRYS